ncbi:MAG: hydantoinase B/oxoprolinase family protein [Spirosomataceae bacterium]
MTQLHYTIAIDTGGTFTDCIASDSTGKQYRQKVLSNSTLRGSATANTADMLIAISTHWGLSKDILKGYQLRALEYDFVTTVVTFEPYLLHLQLAHAVPIELHNQPFSFELTAFEEAPVLAARLVTETALDEPFPPMYMKLGSTKGTNALLELKGAPTAFFVTKGFKDLLRIGNQARPDIFALNIVKAPPLHQIVIEIPEQTDSQGNTLVPIHWATLEQAVKTLHQQGIKSVAVCLKNAYKNPTHEQTLALFLRKHFAYVSVSTELSPQIKFLNRAETAVVNAYLSPVIDDYLSNITQKLPPNSLQVMTSAGNLVKADLFEPKDSLFSGPAGGVVGASVIGKRLGYTQLITFDMGGTSTDVARYDGDFDFQFEQRIGQTHIFSPSLAIETVAAGGGSICYFDGFKLCVGPESAGAKPGPACYGAGGPLTITDVNLLLGRLDIQQFSIPVFPHKAQERLQELQQQIGQATGKETHPTELLLGFVQIANEKMAEAVRKISIAKGYDPSEYALVSFGGAGGLHACGIADLLNIKTILLPQDAGLLSAFGISKAPIERFAERNVLLPFEPENVAILMQIVAQLQLEAIDKVAKEGIAPSGILIRKKLAFLRLTGQDSSLEVELSDFESTFQAFRQKYLSIYGYWNTQRGIEMESIRVIATEIQTVESPIIERPLSYPAAASHHIVAYVSQQPTKIPVYLRENMASGAYANGFAILTDRFSTSVVEEGWGFSVKPDGTGIIEKLQASQQAFTQSQETELELFMNRFTSIAENMGVMLQRTSLSVNVKERLDFSCALVDATGELIANAPHIPVHLGSLGVCVRSVAQAITFQEGDVVITNHPGYGGSHLPDITLISAVFSEHQLVGYVVNRCHHAEVGGIRPASMPPDAKNLAEEGVVIPPMYLAREGKVDWEIIRKVLNEAMYPSRSVEENLADLNAALAANRNGEQALIELVRSQGLVKVHFYMDLLKKYSAEKVRQRLALLDHPVYKATEALDDGSLLCVTIRRNEQAEKPFTIDFSGSAGVHAGNLNGNEAIVQSVVVYVLRTLLAEKIPLNDGILHPIELIIPKQSILKPDFPPNPLDCPAVVGGNVELSQRLTDTLLKAFEVVACSQGTMNNTLFGNATFGYYETVCGGCGAGKGFNGASAVHHHMTNTRITDPEIMELRYPVRLHRFEIRAHSGGKGQWNGGDGIVREIEFLAPVTLSILSQHRQVAPYGLAGGETGQIGNQVLIRQDGSVTPLQGIDGAELSAGDRLLLQTPGGGGYGKTPESPD